MFYSFEASGAPSVEPGPLASDGILRITPSTLRLACSFEIEYTAVYQEFGSTSAATKKTMTGKVTVQIPSVIVEKPTLLDPSGNYETEDAVRLHRDGGRDALDVRFRLTKGAERRLGKGLFELKNLQCLVQLNVPNAGVEGSEDANGALIIPTAHRGPRQLKVRAVKEGKPDTTPTRSLDDQMVQ